MAEKSTGSPNTARDFEEFLKSAPDADDPSASLPVVVTGTVMRSKTGGAFVLQTAEGNRAELPLDAVEAFQVVAGTGATRAVQLTLNRGRISDELLSKLAGLKPSLDTLKEIGGGDTLKEQPWDTLKEIGGGDTLKEQPFDTLKEIGGGGDTLKEQPWDTLKEIGGGDTFKEQPFDTLKEIGGSGDTLKEVGEGTGIADTWIEGIPGPGGGATLAEGGGVPGLPGGGVVQPELGLMQARAAAPAGQMQAAALKPIAGDLTLKELTIEHTFKELAGDPKHIKEIVKELPKEVAWEGTGAADTLVEGRPDWGSVVTNPAAGGVPFVLATPHQASQGAVAQQMLAAQAMMGRLGY